jgi:integrase
MEDQENLKAFQDYLSKTKRVSPKTLKDYSGYFKLIDQSKALDQNYVNSFLQEHNNNVNIRGMMSNLLQFLGLDFTIRMPPKPTGKKKKRVIRPITKEEIERFKDYLYSISFKHGLVFDLLYQGAMRRAEIKSIKINSFEWNNWINTREEFCELIILGKNDKERRVLINSETMEKILNYYIKKGGADINNLDPFFNSSSLLFQQRNGTPVNEAFVYTMIKRGSKRCLGKDIRPHELRHHRATELEAKRVSIKSIKNYLGHSNLTTTEIYLHQSEAEGLKEIKRLS